MSTAPSNPNTAASALEAELRQAVLDGDMARTEELAFSGPLSDNFRFELIGGVIAAGDTAPLVGRLLDAAGDDVTPTAYVSYLAKAAEQGRADTAVLLLQKCADAGIEFSEGVERVVKNAPADKIGTLALAIDKSAPDKNVIANMMLNAGMERKYETLGALLDLQSAGGTRGHGAIIMMRVMNDREEIFDGKKQEYMSLMTRLIDVCAECEPKSLSMTMLLAVYKLPEGKEYPELVEKFAAAGADPFLFKEEAKRFLTNKYIEQDDTASADKWRARIDDWQTAYTAKHRHTFDTLFGDNFRLQDLLQPATEQGETGLQLAARARRLPEVMRALERGGSLALDDVFNEPQGGESAIHLAIDRGDAAHLLAPEYWARKEVDIVSALETRLSDDRKKWIDMDTVSAQADLHRLQKITDDFGAQYQLRPRFG
ncbi:MAG TPA: hypothetical protein PLW48_02970 [Alphaproteobacteria bacterium]|nr:hypothetical protein [Alphaproteobacteria bacterium]